MSSSDSISVIEDEPYKGLYHDPARPGAAQPVPDHIPDRFDLAEILRATREARGLTLDEVVEITRVRRAYLEALEQAAYDVLPPRAFSIGYVKAYAKALDLDEETLADMFKRDMSETNTRLQAPSGASLDDVKPNYRLIVTGVACLVGAIAVWNIFQHRPVMSAFRKSQDLIASQPWSVGMPLIHDGAVYVTRPAPPPKDQDIPAPYVTPGLEAQFASLEASANGDAAAPVPVQDVLTRKAFNPEGAVYGAAPENSTVTIQATQSVNLIERTADGTIYFAQQLAPGEAFRLPQNTQQDLVIEVSDFKPMELYYNGELAGNMDALVTPIGKLNATAAALSSALDARQAALSGQPVKGGFALTAAPKAPQIIHHNEAPIPYLPASKVAAEPKTAAHASASAVVTSSAAVESSASTPAPAPDATPPATGQ